MTKHHMAFSAVMVTAGVAICIWLAYLLCGLLFRFTGTPSAPWQHIIIGILGMYLFFGTVKVGAEIHNKHHGRKNDFRHRLLDETLAALNRIAS